MSLSRPGIRGAELFALEGHRHNVWSVAFTPDGRLITTGGADRTVRVWEVDTGLGLMKLPLMDAWGQAVAFSPDGARLAAATGGSVIVWDSLTGRELAVLDSPVEYAKGRARIWDVKSSHDGRKIAVALQGAIACVWEADDWRNPELLGRYEPLPVPNPPRAPGVGDKEEDVF